MLRLLLIAVLLMQAVVAQAAVADVFCVHNPPGHNHAMHTSADSGDVSHGNCACEAGGHCSSTATGSTIPIGANLSLSSTRPATATAAVVSGYRSSPYRPPTV